MKTLTMIDKFKDYWNNYIPLSKRQAITWLNKIEKELKVLKIIKENALYVDWTWLFDCVINNRTYEDYIDGCNATKQTTIADKEEYNLLKEILC